MLVTYMCAIVAKVRCWLGRRVFLLRAPDIGLARPISGSPLDSVFPIDILPWISGCMGAFALGFWSRGRGENFGTCGNGSLGLLLAHKHVNCQLKTSEGARYRTIEVLPRFLVHWAVLVRGELDRRSTCCQIRKSGKLRSYPLSSDHGLPSTDIHSRPANRRVSPIFLVLGLIRDMNMPILR